MFSSLNIDGAANYKLTGSCNLKKIQKKNNLNFKYFE